MESHDKSFLIALLSWVIFSLAFTFAGVYFTTALASAVLVSIAVFLFFEYVYYDNEKKTEC